MKLHLVGLPHTQTVVEQMTVCAFTQKIVKFGEMMTGLGYDVIVYSGEHNDTICAEHVSIFSDAKQFEWYGEHNPVMLPTVATWNWWEPHWRYMNARAILEIGERIEDGDLILILAGWAQKPIADAFPQYRSCEWAAGYSGIFSPFVCFESSAWMHHLYGKNGIDRGRDYDTVIPNFFRPEDFAFGHEDERGDYLLFVGRVTASKGPQVAAEIARASGRRLIVAGSGVTEHVLGRIVGDQCVLEGDVEYVGVAGVDERNELMRRAHAILVPTRYIEPFGAVAVEAQMCGTPAITSDFGAFRETVDQGVSGFRFRTLAEGVEAVERASDLDHELIRSRAIYHYSLDAIGPLYDRWFQQLDGLRRGGWYELPTVREAV